MSSHWILRGLWAGALGGLTALLLFAAPASADLAADHALMMEWFEGEFDNFQQVWVERETEAEHPHEHIHSIFARVALPALGDDVFYVQQYSGGDPTKVYRQRLYSFAPDTAEEATVLRIYAFPEGEPYIDAHLDPSKLEGLTLEKLRATPGCEVYWKRDGERFLGVTKPDACRVKSRRSGKMLIITDELVFTKDEIWINDRAKDEAGNHVFGHKGNVPGKLKRCRFFTGWTVLQKEKGEDGGSEAYDIQRGFRIHDQGGRFEFGHAEKTYVVELAQLIQQSRQTRVFTLKLYEKGNDRAFAYTWVSPEAKRVGINLRWIQAGFALEPPAQEGGEQ